MKMTKNSMQIKRIHTYPVEMYSGLMRNVGYELGPRFRWDSFFSWPLSLQKKIVFRFISSQREFI